jgi:hypothetical protein
LIWEIESEGMMMQLAFVAFGSGKTASDNTASSCLSCSFEKEKVEFLRVLNIND